MRYTTASVAAVVAAAGLVAGTVGGAPAASRPQLKLVRVKPMTVRGSGFAGHEHVRVVLREAGSSVTTRAVASAAGAFTASFATARISRCAGFSVSASGSRGSRATMRRPLPLPACAPVREPPSGQRSAPAAGLR